MLRANESPAAPSPAAGRALVFPLSPKAVLTSLFSFEALVVLYLLAGLYKEDPRFAWIPLDPTVLFFALSVTVGVFLLVLQQPGRRGLYPVVAMLLLVIWFGASLAWSPSREYGMEKVFLMATLVLWAMVASAMIIASDRVRVRRFFLLLVVASIVAALEAISVYLQAGGGRLHIGSGSYLALGRLCGVGAVIVFMAWLAARSRFGLFGLTCLALFLLFGFVLAIGGGRGPLLATAGALVVPIIVGIRVNARGVHVARYQTAALALAVLAVGVLTVWVQSSEQTPETLRRLEGLVGSEYMGNSAATRAEYYQLAPELWADAPLVGHGAGSWALLTGHGDIQRYPHNLFAEVVVEGGLVGLVLLGGLFAVALFPVSTARLRADPLAMCAMMLFVNALLNSMVSGDLPGNRMLFVSLGLLTICALPQSDQRPSLGNFLRSASSPALRPATRVRARPDPRSSVTTT